MKYSIIIPTLNEEKLLPKLLKQIIENNIQDKYDTEIIISDGGSKDKTLEIALQYSDIVKVHREDYPQNIAIGRNEGSKFANGDVLIFINGDVVFHDPNKFFQFLEDKFYKSNYAAMTCKVKVFPEEVILSDKLFHAFYNKYFHMLNIFGVGMGRGECQVIKKKVFDSIGGNKEDLAAGEDFDLFMKITKHGKVLYTNDVWVYESPRRYRKIGYFGVTWSWLKNSTSIVVKNKSISKEWEQVR